MKENRIALSEDNLDKYLSQDLIVLIKLFQANKIDSSIKTLVKSIIQEGVRYFPNPIDIMDLSGMSDQIN